MSDDLVLTPGGLRPASLLHRVEEGEVLHAANGVVHKLALDTGNFSLAVESLAQVSLRHADSAALGSGWISDAYWNNGTGNTIQSFTADWVVPPMPATQSGQLIYLFNGIQNYGNNFGILQPVLQWGQSPAGGGPFWAVANWYVTSGGQAFHTPPVRVEPGQPLTGVMTLTGRSSGFNYTSAFTGIGATLTIQNIAELLWCNLTLEAYGIGQCSDYPPGGVAFTAVGIEVEAGFPDLSWTAQNLITDCGQTTLVASNNNPGGAVNIVF